MWSTLSLRPAVSTLSHPTSLGARLLGGSQQEDSSHPCPPHPLDNKLKLQKTELGTGVMPRGQGAIQANFLKEVVPWRVARGGKDFHFSKCLD